MRYPLYDFLSAVFLSLDFSLDYFLYYCKTNAGEYDKQKHI